MSLIKCPDCGKEFSDQAIACPNCGRPNKETNPTIQTPPNISSPSANQRYRDVAQMPKKNSGLSVAALILSIFGCTFIFGVILAIIDLCKKDETKKHTLSEAAFIISLIWLILIAAANVNKKPSDVVPNTSVSKQAESLPESSAAKASELEVIVYSPVTATQLSDALQNNALKAKDEYANKYIEITGKLGNIDSNGKYIDIDTEDFSFTIIQCYIKNDDQKKVIMEKSKGDKVIVRGLCKDVGEIMGYSIDIDSIE